MLMSLAEGRLVLALEVKRSVVRTRSDVLLVFLLIIRQMSLGAFT